mmetsp:Transcript_26552/g.65692  ORF Transcript_26552/g.65692 Transcript_26552/m.65692 type:complete len:222 (+) Transcript_26552:1230-1895(+)
MKSVAQVDGQLADVHEGVLVGDLQVDAADVDDARRHEDDVLEHLAAGEATGRCVREVETLQAMLNERVGQVDGHLPNHRVGEERHVLADALAPHAEQRLEQLGAQLWEDVEEAERSVQLAQHGERQRAVAHLVKEVERLQEEGLDARLVLPPVRPRVRTVRPGLGLLRAVRRLLPPRRVAAEDAVEVLQAELHHQVEHVAGGEGVRALLVLLAALVAKVHC